MEVRWKEFNSSRPCFACVGCYCIHNNNQQRLIKTHEPLPISAIRHPPSSSARPPSPKALALVRLARGLTR